MRKSLLSTYQLDTVAAINWGIVHESTALDVYRGFGATVEATGRYIYLYDV